MNRATPGNTITLKIDGVPLRQNIKLEQIPDMSTLYPISWEAACIMMMTYDVDAWNHELDSFFDQINGREAWFSTIGFAPYAAGCIFEPKSGIRTWHREGVFDELVIQKVEGQSMEQDTSAVKR